MNGEEPDEKKRMFTESMTNAGKISLMEKRISFLQGSVSINMG